MDLNVSGRKPRGHGRSLSRRSKTNSTRRFCVRPARVSFAAMKQHAPRALTLSVGVSLGWVLSRWSRTARARARASDSLKASGPVLSVRPMIVIWRAESRVAHCPIQAGTGSGAQLCAAEAELDNDRPRSVDLWGLGRGAGGTDSAGEDCVLRARSAGWGIRREGLGCAGRAGRRYAVSRKLAWRPKSSWANCAGGPRAPVLWVGRHRRAEQAARRARKVQLATRPSASGSAGRGPSWRDPHRHQGGNRFAVVCQVFAQLRAALRG
jgi:hypothetical protein